MWRAIPVNFIFLLQLFYLRPIVAQAQGSRYGIEDKSGTVLPGDVYLLNEDSVWVKFGDLITKPTLLSFVYYKCPGLCSPVMDGIAEMIDKTDLKIGKDYQVITISIDAKEPISLARKKKAHYLKTMKTQSAKQFWQFYVADSNAIKTLTDAAGWGFKHQGKNFAHSAATIMLTPNRMVSQYFYGTFIFPMSFHMAVNDAKNELTNVSRIEDPKYCLNYTQPPNKIYSLMVAGGGITVLVMAIILFIWLTLTSGETKRLEKPVNDKI